MYVVNHGKSASATLPTPTQQESTLLSRVPTHTYAECKLSCQQPAQLHMEFPRLHNVGHSKKKDSHMCDATQVMGWWERVGDDDVPCTCTHV